MGKGIQVWRMLSGGGALGRLLVSDVHTARMNSKSNPGEPAAAADTEEAPSFEQLLEQLEAIVARMEAGNLPLEDTLQDFERGQALAAQCEARLRDATQRVHKLLDEGDASAQPGSPEQ